MNDFNRGALQVPCLRLDYGFGEQWASVELGDGTGYVRLSDYDKAEVENTKLRELVREMMRFFEDGDYCAACEKVAECDAQEEYDDDCLMRGVFHANMRELDVEVDK